MSTEFKYVPLGLVWESKTNPRRHFSEQGMQELTASVKASGVLVPLIVVADDDGFEIVAGARRYRAAKAAGLTMIPVIVRDLTKEQVLEAQVIENLQREDVHPLDEANAVLASEAGEWNAHEHFPKVLKSFNLDIKKIIPLTEQPAAEAKPEKKKGKRRAAA